MPFPHRLAVLCLVLLSASGCAVFDDSTSPLDRVRLIEDMSSQLERGRHASYYADYQLAGGVKATVGQQQGPPRTAYAFPGGLILVDATGQTQCDTTLHPVKCQLRSVAPAAGGLPDSFAEATKRGLITAPVLDELLRLTSLQLKAEVKPQDATIAGQPASCLTVTGLTEAPAAGFTACVTSDGVLASFTGEVGGVLIDQALFRVRRKAGDESFALPEGARIQDLRQS